MILARNVTRSFDFYEEVEITEELLDKIEEAGYELDLEDVIHNPNDSAMKDIWDMLEELHWDGDGGVIFKEEELMPNQNYNDEVDYLIIEQSNLIEKVEAY